MKNLKSVSHILPQKVHFGLNTYTIGLVWSKSDCEIPSSTKEQILEHLEQNPYAHFSQFTTSVQEGKNGIFHQNICESINWIIEKLKSNINSQPQIISLIPEDMFLSKRQANE